MLFRSSMPVFAFLPTALCGLLSNPTDRQISTARRFALGFMAILPLGGIAMLASSFKQGSESAVEPDFEVAKESAAVFSKAFGAPVRIVGGSVRYSTSATLDLPGHPRAWVHFNDYWWITPEMIAENGALGFCAMDDERCRQRAQQIVSDRKGWTCEIERRRTLWGMQGKKTKVYLYFIPPQQLMASLPPAESRCPPPLLP